MKNAHFTTATIAIASATDIVYTGIKAAHKWDVEVASPALRFTWTVVSPYAWQAFKWTVVELAGLIAFLVINAPKWFERATEDSGVVLEALEVAKDDCLMILEDPKQAASKAVYHARHTVAPALASVVRKAAIATAEGVQVAYSAAISHSLRQLEIASVSEFITARS